MAKINRGPQVAGVAYFFVSITTVIILARIYTRTVLMKSFGWDDTFAVAAQVLFISYAICSISGVHYGTGQKTETIAPDSLPIALKFWWFCEPFFVLSNMALKMSIALFLLRLCVTRTQRYFIYGITALAEIYGFAFFLLFVLQCQPTSYFWSRQAPNPPKHGKCIDATITANAFYAYSAIACLTDWSLSILPIFLVWNLQMRKKTKVTVAMILAVGVFASTATIVRIPYLHTMTDTAQFLFATSDVAIWSSCETGIGIMASSLATLRPLFRAVLPAFFDSEGDSSAGGKTRPWTTTGSKGGYLKSTNNGVDNNIMLRGDLKSAQGVTTVVDGGKGSESTKGLKLGENEIMDDSSSEEYVSRGDNPWAAHGIRKTVVHTQETA